MGDRDSRRAPQIGLSSGSFSTVSGQDAVELSLRLGCTAVDLRAGKGHAWEKAGISPFIDGGIEVAFVGLSCVLGRTDVTTLRERHERDIAHGLPVKVFCSKGALHPEAAPTTTSVIDYLADRLGSTGRILVETHHGYASVEELLLLAGDWGVQVLLDTMGLWRITSSPARDAARLAAYVTAAQVKGFDPLGDASGPHRQLSSCVPWHAEVLAAVGDLEFLTLESKAGSVESDIAAMHKLTE